MSATRMKSRARNAKKAARAFKSGRFGLANFEPRLAARLLEAAKNSSRKVRSLRLVDVSFADCLLLESLDFEFSFARRIVAAPLAAAPAPA